MTLWKNSRSSGKPVIDKNGNSTLQYFWVKQPLIPNVNRCPYCRNNKLTDEEFVNHVLTRHPKRKEDFERNKKWGVEAYKTSAHRQQDIDDAKEFGRLMDERYKTKDTNGKYKHNIFDDLKDMNTDPAGNCECIQCGKTFIYDETDVNMCKKCMKEMF
jgi:hypothetical protein